MLTQEIGRRDLLLGGAWILGMSAFGAALCSCGGAVVPAAAPEVAAAVPAIAEAVPAVVAAVPEVAATAIDAVPSVSTLISTVSRYAVQVGIGAIGSGIWEGTSSAVKHFLPGQKSNAREVAGAIKHIDTSLTNVGLPRSSRGAVYGVNSPSLMVGAEHTTGQVAALAFLHLRTGSPSVLPGPLGYAVVGSVVQVADRLKRVGCTCQLATSLRAALMPTGPVRVHGVAVFGQGCGANYKAHHGKVEVRYEPEQGVPGSLGIVSLTLCGDRFTTKHVRIVAST